MALLRYRESRVRKAGKVYVYGQLVRAERRDGKPTHKVIAHLGRLSASEAGAIKAALRGLRERDLGDDETANALRAGLGQVRAVSALRYLDVRVVHDVWQRWGLDAFFAEHLPPGRSKLAPAHLVEMLVVNRAVAPCSKLSVPRWVRNTALPELLGCDVERVDNTRIHRVLAALEPLQHKLERFLIGHKLRKGEAKAVLYFDLTSTWFEGRGGDLAEPGRDKSGAMRRKLVQVALVVDGDGRPLRWEVIRGSTSEKRVLPKWLDALDSYPELRDLPFVFDRGMASEPNLRLLLHKRRKFVTCSPSPNLADWVPEQTLDGIAATAQDTMPTRSSLEALGLTYIDDDLYLIDKHTIERLPNGKTDLPASGLRAVAYFRPSLFDRHRKTNAKQHRKVLSWVEQLNEALGNAANSRNEAATRRKVERYLEKRRRSGEYQITLEPIELPGNKRPIRSFRVHVDAVEHRHRARARNAGWVVLFASPYCTDSAAELVSAYHRKDVVEHAFKIIKSFAKLRPFRHQTAPKIRAHVTLCMLAVLLDRDLELRLRAAGAPTSSQHLYELLEPSRLQVLQQAQGKHVFRVAPPDATARHLLSALDLDHFTNQEAIDRLHRCRY